MRTNILASFVQYYAMMPPPFRGSCLRISTLCPDGEIGRHTRLKILRLNSCAGSIPAPGTTKYNVYFVLFEFSK